MLTRKELKEIYEALFYIADVRPRGIYYQRYFELAMKVWRVMRDLDKAGSESKVQAPL